MERNIHIYALSDPRDGRVRYVGRTVNPLARRLREHINTSARGKIKDKRKAEWIFELASLGLKPVIAALEKTSMSDFKVAEKRWVSHYRESHLDLLNIKCGGDGGMGGHFVIWTKELESMLGIKADSIIAEKMGVTRKTVSYRRDQLGIAASFDRTRNTPPPRNEHLKKILSIETMLALGSMPDHALARIAGVDKKRIQHERAIQGIQSFADKTGNNGMFDSKPRPWKFELNDPRLSILGTMTDKNAAEILNLSFSRTATIRNILGIQSYRKLIHGTNPSQSTN